MIQLPAVFGQDTSIEPVKLQYDSKDFAVAARKAIAAGDVFTFDIAGRAWERLRSHVTGDQVLQWAPLPAIPELQQFVAVMALAQVESEGPPEPAR